MTCWRFLLTFLVASSVICPNAWSGNDKSLLKTSAAFDTGRYSVQVSVTNTSGWEIDAFNLTTEVTYSDGTKMHTERLVDLLPKLDAQLSAGEPTTPFALGKTRDELISVERHPGVSVDHIEATVDLIVSGPKIKANNKVARQELVLARIARAESDEAAAQVILKNLNNQNTSQAISRSITELENLRAAEVAGNSRQYLEVSILNAIYELELLQTRESSQKPELLKGLANAGQNRAKKFRERAQLVDEE